MRVTLEVEEGGKHRGRRITLRQLPLLIGRDPKCHLRPVSQTVSKTHCALELDEGKLILRDFGSTNGTYVNGQLLNGDKVDIADGDEVAVGPLYFIVRVAPSPS